MKKLSIEILYEKLTNFLTLDFVVVGVELCFPVDVTGLLLLLTDKFCILGGCGIMVISSFIFNG